MKKGLFNLLALSILCSCGAQIPDNLAGDIQFAYLTVPDEVLYDFGTRAVNTSTDKSFTVVNQGGRVATSVTGHFGFSAYSFKGGTFPGIGGTCSTVIQSAEQCVVVITFAPTYPGTFNEFLQLSYFNGANIDTTTSPILKARAVAGP